MFEAIVTVTQLSSWRMLSGSAFHV